ncbi:hypothetical protein P7C70_g6194, partial [Phenoliferia sp. Uapishka_3]
MLTSASASTLTPPAGPALATTTIDSLALETFTHIIKYVNDPLKPSWTASASLVARSWRNPCQRVLFEDVKIQFTSYATEGDDGTVCYPDPVPWQALVARPYPPRRVIFDYSGARPLAVGCPALLLCRGVRILTLKSAQIKLRVLEDENLQELARLHLILVSDIPVETSDQEIVLPPKLQSLIVTLSDPQNFLRDMSPPHPPLTRALSIFNVPQICHRAFTFRIPSPYTCDRAGVSTSFRALLGAMLPTELSMTFSHEWSMEYVEELLHLLPKLIQTFHVKMDLTRFAGIGADTLFRPFLELLSSNQLPELSVFRADFTKVQSGTQEEILAQGDHLDGRVESPQIELRNLCKERSIKLFLWELE